MPTRVLVMPRGEPRCCSAPWMITGLLYYRYTGLIDDVQIYGAALTDRDIQFLFKNPGRTVPVPSPGIELLLLLGDD